MDPLFRLDGAVTHDEAIDVWFAQKTPELASIGRRWFERMRACGNDVRELIHDGCPVACVSDAAFAYVNVFKAHVNVGFYNGADLPDPSDLLEGAGRRMRHVKVRPDTPLDDQALEALIEASYAGIRARVALQ